MIDRNLISCVNMLHVTYEDCHVIDNVMSSCNLFLIMDAQPTRTRKNALFATAAAAPVAATAAPIAAPTADVPTVPDDVAATPPRDEVIGLEMLIAAGSPTDAI